MFELSCDPQFAAKPRDIIGLDLDPPAHSLVLSVDEKSQIQALDRTQPGLPIKRGRTGTMTHDYIRRGTTTLFALFMSSTARWSAQCMQRRRHQQSLRCLNASNAISRPGVGPYDPRQLWKAQHLKVRAWLARHPRWTFHFTPTSAFWLNAVEGFFATLTGDCNAVSFPR